MNLQGSMVKVHFPENELINNNNQPTAPAIVTTDWSPEETKHSAKALNLQIITDGTIGMINATSVMHNSISEQPVKNFTWEGYPAIE